MAGGEARTARSSDPGIAVCEEALGPPPGALVSCPNFYQAVFWFELDP